MADEPYYPLTVRRTNDETVALFKQIRSACLHGHRIKVYDADGVQTTGMVEKVEPLFARSHEDPSFGFAATFHTAEGQAPIRIDSRRIVMMEVG